MTDVRTLFAELRRPRLLIRAARFGLADYRRERDLRRLVDVTRADQTVPRLLSEEALMEEERLAGLASYSVARHVELLIALMAEVRLLPRNA